MHNQVDFSLMPDLQMQMICILRIVLSCLCGAAVGFAIGSGLYLIGIVSTLIIVLVHSIFTKHYDSTSAAVIHMRYEKDEPLPDNLTEQIEQQFGCKVKAIYSKRTDSGNIHVNLVIHAKGNQNLEKLSIDLLKDPHYRAIDM